MYMEVVIRYVKYFFNETKKQHTHIDDNLLKSALAYQYLYYKHFNISLTVFEILEMTHYNMGLIGPDNSKLSQFLETSFG